MSSYLTDTTHVKICAGEDSSVSSMVWREIFSRASASAISLASSLCRLLSPASGLWRCVSEGKGHNLQFIAHRSPPPDLETFTASFEHPMVRRDWQVSGRCKGKLGIRCQGICVLTCTVQGNEPATVHWVTNISQWVVNDVISKFTAWPKFNTQGLFQTKIV